MLINKTPHPIHIYSHDTPDIGATAEQLAAGLVGSIPPQGPPTRLAKIELGTWGSECFEGGERPVYVGVEGVEFGHAHDLPQPADGVRYIVSMIVALACPGRSDLVVPYLEVRNSEGTVIGCKMLAQPA